MASDLTPIFAPGDVLPQQLTPSDPSPEPDGPAGGESSVTPGPPWERYVSAIVRHKWLILLITVCGGVGGIVATRFVHLAYLAQSTLWIEVTTASEAQTGPIREGQLLQSYAWLELLRSFTVLDHVVREQGLYVLPAKAADAPLFAGLVLKDQFRAGTYTLRVDRSGKQYVLTAGDAVEIERGPTGGPVGLKVGLVWTPPAAALRPDRAIEFTVQNPRDVATALGAQLKTEMAEQGNFLMLSLEGTDPQRITATVNSVARRYVTVAAQLKRTKLDELTAILDEQLRYAEANLHSAESALESFRVQTVTLPSQQASPLAAGLALTRDPVFNNFFELKVQREQLRQDREAIERVLREAATTPSALDGLNGIPAVVASSELGVALGQRTAKRTELRAIQQRYTEAYAPVRALLSAVDTLEQQTIPQLARAEIARLASQEAAADGRIGSASNELQQIPPRAIEEARLQRQVTVAQDLQTTLKQRYEVARLAAAGSIPDIRVLDAAVEPSAPTSDKRALLVLAGLFGSFGLAVIGVLVHDRVDPRIRYPEQVTRDTGLAIIGIVPHLNNTSGLADVENASAVSEAFREIRLSLLHAYGSAGPVLFTVTSAEPADGKSFVSSNLALAFAHQGYRTLLIDGDIRRGRLHHLLGCQRAPGLTDFLAGKVDQTEIIQESGFAGIHLVGSGTRMEIGPELLGSPTMQQFIRGMRSRYEVIVVDSPPLGAGVDPYVLGTVTGNLLLVFRTGNTSRSFANAKLQLLDRLPVRLLGAVLNDVPSNQKAYRYYSYIPGYGAEDEQVVLAAREGEQEEVEPGTDVTVSTRAAEDVRLGNFR
jgi:succinoglycan biosynthesis transport protein ExoP